MCPYTLIPERFRNRAENTPPQRPKPNKTTGVLGHRPTDNELHSSFKVKRMEPSLSKKANCVNIGCQTDIACESEQLERLGLVRVEDLREENAKLKNKLEEATQLHDSLIKHISVQESLLISKNTPDFQNQILVKELNKAKEEIKSLNAVVATLQADARQLLVADSIPSTTREQRCLNCFPKISEGWKKSTVKSRSNHVDPVWALPLANRFSALDDNVVLESVNVNAVESAVVELDRGTQAKNVRHLSSNKNSGIKYKDCVNRRKSKVLILADSNGRGCSRILQEELGSRFEVKSFFKPNAKFSDVTRDIGKLGKNHTDEDFIVVLAGSNDFQNNLAHDTLKTLKYIKPDCSEFSVDSLIGVTKHTNVLVGGIPLRFEIGGRNLNEAIKKTNINLYKKLEHLKSLGCRNIVTVKRTVFNRLDHTRHGLHLNRLGKKKLCNMFAQSIMYHLNRGPHEQNVSSATPEIIGQTLSAYEPRAAEEFNSVNDGPIDPCQSLAADHFGEPEECRLSLSTSDSLGDGYQSVVTEDAESSVIEVSDASFIGFSSPEVVFSKRTCVDFSKNLQAYLQVNPGGNYMCQKLSIDVV